MAMTMTTMVMVVMMMMMMMMMMMLMQQTHILQSNIFVVNPSLLPRSVAKALADATSRWPSVLVR